MLRLAFAGTPDFARAILAALLADGMLPVAVALTQPDRPAGRGLKLLPSPVKAFATEAGLPLLQPRGLRLDGRFGEDAALARKALAEAELDVLVVAAYGLILPPWLLALPRYGCINVHASLLPRWRGAAPIQRAIEAGDSESGVSIMQMDAGLDTGAVIALRATALRPDDTAASLQARLQTLGAEEIVAALRGLESGPLASWPQADQGATYASKISKSESAVDWQAPAALIERRLRAFDPAPGARSELDGQMLTLWRGRVVPGEGSPGEVSLEPDGAFSVACGTDRLVILELQRPGGRRMATAELIRGWQPRQGATFAKP